MKYDYLFDELRIVRKMELERSREWVALRIGVDASTLRSWEEGRRALSLEKLHEWAHVLGYELVIKLKKKHE